MSQFANEKFSSTRNASNGFWQLKLELTCFNTPFGRYRFLRLPFGISLAPEMYHKAVHMKFEHIEGIDTSMDDIIVYGSTLEEHNECLLSLSGSKTVKFETK